MTKTELRAQWGERVAAFRSSGQSVTSWCAENNLKSNQLWYWLRKYKLVDIPNKMPSQWLSVEIGDLKPSCQKDVLLVRVGQAVIEVQPGFNPALLSDVVRVLAANVE